MAQTTESNTTPTLSQEKKSKRAEEKMHCRYLLENRNERERRQRTLNTRTVDCSAATLLAGERWRYLSSWTRDVNVNKIVTSRKKKKKKSCSVNFSSVCVLKSTGPEEEKRRSAAKMFTCYDLKTQLSTPFLPLSWEAFAT